MTPISENHGLVRVFIFSFVLTFLLSPSAKAQDGVVEHETGIYYTVQKGDTLWSLSQKFADSPWQWPELWNENKEILNPHIIYPGQRIRLFYNKGVLNLEPRGEDELSKEVAPAPPPVLMYSSIDQVGFIRKKPVAFSGKIVRAEGIKSMISQNELIYVVPSQGAALVPGDQFITLRTLPVKDPDSGSLIGHQHLYTGLLEIIRQEGEAVMARVIASFREMEVNDGLIPYVPRKPAITILPGVEGMEGKLLACERGDNVFSADSVVFIDKGRADGISVGQWYAITEPVDFKQGGAGKSLSVTPVQVGKLFVLHTEEETSTVLVASSKKDLVPGQIFVYSTQ